MTTEYDICMSYVRDRIRVGKLYRGVYDEKFRDRTPFWGTQTCQHEKYMKPHRPYILEEYNPQWKETFIEISSRLKKVLGNMALEVEHIGSTSVEEMVAKPQIDLLVVVKDLDLVATKHQAMTDEGFTHHGRGYVSEDDDYFSLNTSEGKRAASIHILQEGNKKISYYLTFRNYLRTHPEERDLYIRVKRDLYAKHSGNYADYDGGKSGVILEIRERAIDWFNELKD